MNYYPTNFYSTYLQASQQLALPGKIVDSIEIAKIGDIPFGGYSIFPKADLSEIYIKKWNSDGTTSLITFQQVVEKNTTQDNNSLLDRIQQLENKIEVLTEKKTVNNPKRKELDASAY